MSPLATIGIMSIGEMGMGIARLLIAHNYEVVTNLEGRSADTHERAKNACIKILPTDVSLVIASDYILSIVPPRHALDMASRITSAFAMLSEPKSTPLYYLDLNAISPKSSREICSLFATKAPSVRYIDGGIIGGAPSLKTANEAKITFSPDPEDTHSWSRPSIPLSGPVKLSSAPISGFHFQETLQMKHISEEIGIASGLKCCFASLSKGFSALAIQSFTTANTLGVLPLLQQELGARFPGLLKAASSMTGVAPKAYRWVREMEEIAAMHSDEGGWQGDGTGIFDGIALLYRSVAENEILSQEKIGRRKRGLTTEDMAKCLGESLKAKKRKND